MTLATGIPELDGYLEECQCSPRSWLFFSDALSDKRLLAERFILTGVQRGEVCLYLDFHRSPALVRADFARIGEFDHRRLILVDTVSTRLMVETQEAYVVEDSTDLVALRDLLGEAVTTEGVTRVALDSLEFLFDRLDRREVLEFCDWLGGFCEEAGAVLVYLFTNWTLSEREIRRLRKLPDCFVEFQSSGAGSQSRDVMRILRNAEEGPIESEWMPVSLLGAIGVPARAPRVLVIGGPKSGKTTFLRALEPNRITVVTDGGEGDDSPQRVQISTLGREVFGAPGDRGHSTTLDVFSHEVDGVILVVDSTDAADIEGSKPVLAMGREGVPMVVAANKQDVPGALNADDVASALDAGPQIPVLGTVATVNRGVWDAMETLLGMMFADTGYRWCRDEQEAS